VKKDESDDEESIEVVKTAPKNGHAKNAKPAQAKKTVVQHDSDDSDDESNKKPANKKAASPKKVTASPKKALASPKKAPVKKPVTKKDDSDDDDSDEPKAKAPVKKPVTKKDDSDDEDDSDSDKPKGKAPVKKPVTKKDESEDEEEETKPTNGTKTETTDDGGHNELFVKNLGYQTTEDGLYNFFSTYGTVTKVKILTNKEDGRSKGIGFVEFSSNSECKTALDAGTNGGLNLDGRDLQVNYSGQKPEPSGNGYGNQGGYGGGQRGGFGGGDRAPRQNSGNTIFVGNLPYKVNENAIKGLFKDCGNVMDVRIAKDRDTGKVKGFAHVEFDSAEAVQNAILKNGVEMEGRQLKVDASEQKSGGGGRGGFGGGRGGGRGGRGGFGGGRGRGGFGDPMAKAQRSGAVLPPSGNKISFDD